MSKDIQQPDYPAIRGFECLSSCIASYLAYRGIPVSESDIFLCGGGYRIRYSGDIYRIEIGADAYQAAFRFLDRYQVKYEHGRMKPSLLKELSERGQVVLVRTIGGRSYHKVFSTIDSPHWIAVTGYDSGSFAVADNAVPDVKESVYHGLVSEEELMDIWGRTGYEYLIVDSKQEQLAGRIQQIRQNSVKELEVGVKRYFHPKKHLFSSVKEGCCSITGLFEDYLEAVPEERAQAMALAQEINRQVRVGGAVSYKKAILQKLREMQAEDTVLKEYGDIIKMWHEIFLHLLKAAIKCDRDGVQRLKKQAEELIERERKCAKFITKEDGTEKKR